MGIPLNDMRKENLYTWLLEAILTQPKYLKKRDNLQCTFFSANKTEYHWINIK